MFRLIGPGRFAFAVAALGLGFHIAGCGQEAGTGKDGAGGTPAANSVAGNEDVAIRGLMAIAKAQNAYHRGTWDKADVLKYARPYSLLHSAKDASGQPIALITADLVAAAGRDGKPRCGYLYADITKSGNAPTPGAPSKPGPPPPPGAASQEVDIVSDFAVCATPAKYGQDGKRTFIVTTSGEVLGKDLGKSEFVEQFPQNPAAAGWTRAEPMGLRLARGEAEAAACLKACCMAQEQFVMRGGPDAKAQYAIPYTLLFSTKEASGEPIKLISEEIAAASGKAGKPRNGYLLGDVARIGGKPVDAAKGYALCATPATYGEGTKLTLVITQSGRILAKDLGKAEFVQDLPSDPEAAGWAELQ